MPAETNPGESNKALADLRAGGQQALAAIYAQNRPRLRRMIELRMDPRLARRVDASDVIQESFLDASRRLNAFLDDPTVPLIVWLRFLVAQKLAAVQRWHFQRQKRDPRREEPLAAGVRPGVDSAVIAREFSASLTSPSQVAHRSEMTVRVRELLDGMDATDREILVLRHFEELSNGEAAAELGLTAAAASKRYIRALTRLKEVARSLNEGSEY